MGNLFNAFSYLNAVPASLLCYSHFTARYVIYEYTHTRLLLQSHSRMCFIEISLCLTLAHSPDISAFRFNSFEFLFLSY